MPVSVSSITHFLFFSNFFKKRLFKCKTMCYNHSCVGALAQLGARLNGIQKVTGSNPVCSTIKTSHPGERPVMRGFLCFGGENAPEKFYGILKRESAYAIMPVGKKLWVWPYGQQKPRRWPPPGFSIPFWQGGLCPRLVAFYFFLSSHLQMQWQITPAMTERTKAMSSSVGQPPFPCRYRGGNIGIIS